MVRAALLAVVTCVAAEAWAAESPDLSPPPLVEIIQEEDAPVAPPPAAAATQVPGGTNAAPGARLPGAPQGAYPYSPAAPVRTAALAPPPGPEVGLMVTESLFGILTAAPSVLLPYYLFLKPMLGQPPGVGMDTTVATVVFVMVFASVPMGVAQTELNIANTSRHYVTESWVASLSALGAQAGVIGLYYLLHNSSPTAPAEAVLLGGSVIGVPLLTMAAINLGKAPRLGGRAGGAGALLSHDPDRGWALGLPTLLPTAGGAHLPLMGGRF
ncbi:MAG: hypothetical protein RL653_2894 [Pseudomonadota bacterium]|jgi:hypothetical protein